MVLAIVFGAIAGTTLVIILIRSLISGVVMAMLFSAALEIMVKFLPELFAAAKPKEEAEVAAPAAAPPPADTGNRLNIVLADEEDSPHDSGYEQLKMAEAPAAAVTVLPSKPDKASVFEQASAEDLAKMMRTAMSKDE
ncbi:MAG: hypothetical protein FWE37_06120 [Spirochaetaceae bacterium]|nr:hypothetical protein [Spirochaetaceae bacterium]